MKKILISIITILFFLTGFSQNNEVIRKADSLMNIINTTNNKIIKQNTYEQISNLIKYEHPDTVVSIN